MKILNKQLKT